MISDYTLELSIIKPIYTEKPVAESNGLIAFKPLSLPDSHRKSNVRQAMMQLTQLSLDKDVD